MSACSMKGGSEEVLDSMQTLLNSSGESVSLGTYCFPSSRACQGLCSWGFMVEKKIPNNFILPSFSPFPPHRLHPSLSIPTLFPYSDIYLSAILLSRVRLFATTWTVAYQTPPSMELSRQEYWSELPFPSPGDLPDPEIEPGSPAL